MTSFFWASSANSYDILFLFSFQAYQDAHIGLQRDIHYQAKSAQQANEL